MAEDDPSPQPQPGHAGLSETLADTLVTNLRLAMDRANRNLMTTAGATTFCLLLSIGARIEPGSGTVAVPTPVGHVHTLPWIATALAAAIAFVCAFNTLLMIERAHYIVLWIDNNKLLSNEEFHNKNIHLKFVLAYPSVLTFRISLTRLIAGFVLVSLSFSGITWACLLFPGSCASADWTAPLIAGLLFALPGVILLRAMRSPLGTDSPAALGSIARD